MTNTRFDKPWSTARVAATLGILALVSGCAPLDRLKARLELKEGNQSYLRGDFETAIVHYDRALLLVPTLARPQLNRAFGSVALFRASHDAQERRRLAETAVTSFQRYLEVADSTAAPGRDRVEQHILTLYLDSQQPEKAIGFLKARLQRHPKDVAALQMLANLDAERGDLDQALVWHRRLIEIEPDRPESHSALGALAWKFSYLNRVAFDRREALLDEGLRATLRAVEIRPDYFEALTYANLLHREMAKYAASDTERAMHETSYTEYEARARQVRDAGKATTGG